MKKIFLLLLVLHAFISFSMPIQLDSSEYLIKGDLDISTGIVILKSTFKKDTLKFDGGRFQFKGSAYKTSLALIEIQPLGGIPTDLILEPGQITVTVKNGVCTIGGTPNNSRYQQIRNQLSSFRKTLADLQNRSYTASGAEKAKFLKAIDSLHVQRLLFTGKLIRQNPNYAGLVTLQTIYRKELPSNLVCYLEEFKAFESDELYQLVFRFYQDMVKIEKGFPVANFSLPNQQGRQISLESFKGKYVLLDFWYKDCVFCRKLSPVLKKIYADLKPKGFEIVSISIDPLTMKNEWLTAIKEDGSTWTQLWDFNKTLPKKYNVNSYPHLFLLDKDDRLLEQVIGYYEEEELRKILNKHIL